MITGSGGGKEEGRAMTDKWDGCQIRPAMMSSVMTLLYDDKYEADLSDFDALFEYLYLSCKFFFAVLSLTTFSSND